MIKLGGHLIKYPRTIWRKSKFKSESAHDEGCVICGKRFSKDDLVFTKEIQFNWFRGDDTKESFCLGCLPPREKRRPENLRM